MKLILAAIILFCGFTTTMAQRSSYQVWFDNNGIMESRMMNDMKITKLYEHNQSVSETES